MDKRAKWLFVFAPEGYYPWDDMSEDFEQGVFIAVEEGSGLSDISAEKMLDIILY